MRKTYFAVALAMMFALTIVCAATADAYSGSLTTSDGMSGGIRGTGAWWPMTISWNVYQIGDLWRYCYELTSTDKDISHFIIEVSPSFSAEDIVNCSWSSSYVEVGTFSQGGSNPNMPGPIYGIKFDGYAPDSKHWVITFDSVRAPVWGDFYTKDGKSGGEFNAAWNEGYLRDDPLAPACDGSIDNHILRPDTKTVVPEPGGLLAMFSCLGSAAGLIKLRGKNRS